VGGGSTTGSSGSSGKNISLLWNVNYCFNIVANWLKAKATEKHIMKVLFNQPKQWVGHF
jgi:hypothetical protein